MGEDRSDYHRRRAAEAYRAGWALGARASMLSARGDAFAFARTKRKGKPPAGKGVPLGLMQFLTMHGGWGWGDEEEKSKLEADQYPKENKKYPYLETLKKVYTDIDAFNKKHPTPKDTTGDTLLQRQQPSKERDEQFQKLVMQCKYGTEIHKYKERVLKDNSAYEEMKERLKIYVDVLECYNSWHKEGTYQRKRYNDRQMDKAKEKVAEQEKFVQAFTDARNDLLLDEEAFKKKMIELFFHPKWCMTKDRNRSARNLSERRSADAKVIKQYGGNTNSPAFQEKLRKRRDEVRVGTAAVEAKLLDGEFVLTPKTPAREASLDDEFVARTVEDITAMTPAEEIIGMETPSTDGDDELRDIDIAGLDPETADSLLAEVKDHHGLDEFGKNFGVSGDVESLYDVDTEGAAAAKKMVNEGLEDITVPASDEMDLTGLDTFEMVDEEAIGADVRGMVAAA